MCTLCIQYSYFVLYMMLDINLINLYINNSVIFILMEYICINIGKLQ